MKTITANDIRRWIASYMDNPPRGGVWSGRGIGIPVGGAVDGSGDGSKYLGRPPRPTDGGMSQSADSTFSTNLSRVNRGFDPDEAETIMFPSQQDSEYEEDEEYEYVRSRKVPHYRGRVKPMNLTLRESRDAQLQDKHLNEGVIRIKDIVSDLLGDTVAAFIGSLDVLDIPFFFLLLWKNRKEIKKSVNKANRLMPSFADSIATATSDTPELKNQAKLLENIAIDIVVDIVDILQAVGYALPGSVGTSGSALMAGQAVTLFGKIALRQLADIKEQASLFLSIPSEERGKPLKELISSAAWEDIKREYTNINPGGITMIGTGFKAIGKIDNLLDEYDALKESGFKLLRRGVSTASGAIHRDIQSEPQTGIESMSREDIESQLTKELIRSLGIKEVRKMISETVYNMYNVPSLHKPMPDGYMFREIPDLLSLIEDPEHYDVLDDYDEFSLSYATDDGIQAGEPRVVSESAAIDIIRNEIAKALDDKRQIDSGEPEKDENDDIESEASVASNVAGYTLPVGGSNHDRSFTGWAEEAAETINGDEAIPGQADSYMKSALKFARSSKKKGEY